MRVAVEAKTPGKPSFAEGFSIEGRFYPQSPTSFSLSGTVSGYCLLKAWS